MSTGEEDIFFPGELATLQNKAYTEKLIAAIQVLIDTDFNRLIQILYNVDIEEKQLKENLAKQAPQQAATIIAGMLIARQIQKIHTREKFKTDNHDSAEERW